MKNTNLLVVVAALLFCGCNTELPTHPPPACDDGNPCTVDSAQGDSCVHEHVTYGDSCIDAPGFCDVNAVCRTECPAEPCLDWSVQIPYGCVYAQRPTGWTCTGDDGHGVCFNGDCVPTGTPPDACEQSTDCFFSNCTRSDCVNGSCVHVAREDGESCFGVVPPGYQPDGGHYGGVCSSGECVLACDDTVVETRLPTVGSGDVAVLCNSCGGDQCSGIGDPCSAYGESCLIGTIVGVCVACCDDENAQLRCAPV